MARANHEIKSQQRLPAGHREFVQLPGHRLQCRIASAEQLWLPSQQSQPRERIRRHAVARRRRVVLRVLQPRDELLVVGGRVKEPASLRVFKPRKHLLCEFRAISSQRGSKVA